MNEDLFFLGIKGIIRNQQGEILLLKVNTSNFANKDKKVYWDIPGGRIHKGNTVEETLKREIEEETGISEINNIKPFSMVLSNIRIPKDHESYGLILSVYICEIDDNQEIQISNEHTEYKWFDSQEASRLLEIKYPKEFTEKIKTL